MIFVPPAVILDGDRAKAASFVGFGKHLLAQLDREVSIRTNRLAMLPKCGQIRRPLQGGGEIRVTIYQNNSYINIFMPFGEEVKKVKVQEDQEEFYYLVFVLGTWEGETIDSPCMVWDINKNDFAIFADPDTDPDEIEFLDYPCPYAKVMEFVSGHEVQYDRGREGAGKKYQGECYRLWVGYGRTSGDLEEMLYPSVDYENSYANPKALCYNEDGSWCSTGYNIGGSAFPQNNTYPFEYACVGIINDYASASRESQYESFGPCGGSGVSGLVSRSSLLRSIWAILPVPNLNSFGTEVLFEQSHTGVVGTEAGNGETVCLRVDRNLYSDSREDVDIKGRFTVSTCKIFNLNEHISIDDSGTKRSIILPLQNTTMRNDEHLLQTYTERTWFPGASTGTYLGSNMFGEAIQTSERHEIRFLIDGDNLSSPYCVPRDGYYKNVMYQFYLSWGRYQDTALYGENTQFDATLAPMYPAGTTFTKDIKVVAGCDMLGVDDPDGPYYHLSEANPEATQHDPRTQNRNSRLEGALDLFIREEQKVVYDPQTEAWVYQTHNSPRPASEEFTRKMYHHFCKTTENTTEETEV